MGDPFMKFEVSSPASPPCHPKFAVKPLSLNPPNPAQPKVDNPKNPKHHRRMAEMSSRK